MKRDKSQKRNWLTALLAGAVLILRISRNPNDLSMLPLSNVQRYIGEPKNTDLTQLELQVHIAEYDALLREHELLQKMRQELGLYTLAATVALAGAFIGQITIFANKEFLLIFLILPFVFTLMTWWYIRTNYSAGLIERYILTELRPKMSHLVEAQVLNWISFLYDNELSSRGKIVVWLQTLSRLGLIQGPAILSLIIFFLRKEGAWQDWSLVEKLLIASNFLSFIISILLMITTKRLIWNIKNVKG